MGLSVCLSISICPSVRPCPPVRSIIFLFIHLLPLYKVKYLWKRRLLFTQILRENNMQKSSETQSKYIRIFFYMELLSSTCYQPCPPKNEKNIFIIIKKILTSTSHANQPQYRKNGSNNPLRSQHLSRLVSLPPLQTTARNDHKKRLLFVIPSSLPVT